jgi:hypothetical protein
MTKKSKHTKKIKSKAHKMKIKLIKQAIKGVEKPLIIQNNIFKKEE